MRTVDEMPDGRAHEPLPSLCRSALVVSPTASNGPRTAANALAPEATFTAGAARMTQT
jgi:hypothetical protein